MIISLDKLHSYDYKEFSPPLPDFSTLKAFKVSVENTPILLSLSEIHVDDAQGNSAREHGTNPASVQNLIHSLSKGWITTELLPAVRRIKGGQGYKYELVYGFTRTEAMEMSYGPDFKMWFNVINCDDTNIRKIRSFENEELPKTANKESDIKHSLIEEIRSGILKNDRVEIMRWLNAVCPNRADSSKNRILSMVEEAVGTPSKYELYTEAKANRWVLNHSAIHYEFGGALVNGVHTFLCRSGYQYRTYQRMIKHYLKDKRPCQVVFHVDSPTKKSNLSARRQQTLAEWHDGLNNLKAIGADVSFMTVAGFLPQEKGVDNWSKLVKIQYYPQAQKSKTAVKGKATPLPIDIDIDMEELEDA
jgi:hypothetical protein